jgi:cellulose synthase/poly-beta-1,6-N-acetylglucosamine synthase-like glycosyltransferase
MSGLAEFLLAALALPATLSCGYLLLLTLLSWRLHVPPASSRRMCFDVIVPAHNEEAGITRVVQSLLKIDWPKNQFRVLVVADNCSDATAAVARAQGALVLERTHLTLRGKGYALAYAFDWSIKDDFAKAVVVIDADAVVTPNLLEAFAARIERGARALQASYGVLNPWSSWRTQLLAIAKGAFHTVRSRARERLGVSCGVRGNGWCVTHELLQQIPYEHFSLSEDLEYGIALGLASCRVQYADEAHADADMVSNEKNARSQRQRWEQGRFALVRSNTWPMLRAALQRRSKVCLDLALDLIVPPLSYLVLNIFLLGALAALLSIWVAGVTFWAWWALACAAVLVLHVLRGWQLSGVGARGLIAFAHVPGFILWRIWLLLARKPQQWVRTEREDPKARTP